MSIFSIFNEINSCFGRIMKTFVDTKKTPNKDGYILKKPGLTISIYGQTPETKVSEF
jgi:hypothetical protein